MALAQCVVNGIAEWSVKKALSFYVSLSLFFILEMRMYWLKFQQSYSAHEDKEDTLRMVEPKT